MPTLNEAKEMINKLAEKLGWGNRRKDVATKLWYAAIELGEAGDIWKHRGDKVYMRKQYGIKNKKELDSHMVEEIIDAIFYCLHAINCLNPKLNPDVEFMRKYRINVKRKRRYIDDSGVKR